MIMLVVMAVITTAGGKVEAAQYVVDNVRDAHEVLHGGEDGRPRPPHQFGISFHHVQTGPHCLGQIRLVDYQHVALRDSWPSLSRDLVSAGYVDDVEGEIGQLVAEVGGEVVATAFAY